VPIPLLLSLLLQATRASEQAALLNADSRFTDWAIRLLPIAISLYVLLSGRSREDRKAHDALLKELVLAKENHQERMKGLQLELERMGDDMMRRHQDHEQKLAQVGIMAQEIAAMKSDLRHVLEGNRDLSAKMDRLLERSK
jgi:hypothetical protein